MNRDRLLAICTEYTDPPVDVTIARTALMGSIHGVAIDAAASLPLVAVDVKDSRYVINAPDASAYSVNATRSLLPGGGGGGNTITQA